METVMRKSDKWIPWYFVLFFVVLAILDGIFVYLATSTQTGVVTEHSYKKGLEYNQTIAAAEVQEKLGWKGEIRFQRNAVLQYSLNDAGGDVLRGATVHVYLTRPTQSGYDQVLIMQENNAGIYEVEPVLPFPGIWDVRVKAEKGGQSYQQSTRIFVKQEQ